MDLVEIKEADVSWVIPGGYYELLSMQLKGLGRGKKAKTL